MNIAMLESFYWVVKSGLVTKASEQLHITQPAVSQQIKALEKQLGVKLLVRSNKGIQPTPAGKVLFEHAEKILKIRASLFRHLEQLAQNQEALIVGASSMIGNYALPCSIYIFQNTHPQGQVKLQIRNSAETMSALLDGAVHVGVIEGHYERPDLEAHPLAETDMVLVTPANNYWRNWPDITLEQVPGIPLIIREPGSGTRKAVEDTLRHNGMKLRDLNIIMELNSLDAIKSAVESGHGASIIPSLAVRKEVRTGRLLAIPFRGISFTQRIVLYQNRRRDVTPLQKEFVRFIKSKNRSFC